MDNRIFDVNGEGIDRLKQTISLAMDNYSKVDGYRIDKKAGIVLLWHCDNKNPLHVKFPSPVSPEMAAIMAYEWVMSKDALETPDKDGWDKNADHDGSNERGWRAYVNEWGHIKLLKGDDERYGIVAIKPAYIWYGK